MLNFIQFFIKKGWWQLLPCMLEWWLFSFDFCDMFHANLCLKNTKTYIVDGLKYNLFIILFTRHLQLLVLSSSKMYHLKLSSFLNILNSINVLLFSHRFLVVTYSLFSQRPPFSKEGLGLLLCECKEKIESGFCWLQQQQLRNTKPFGIYLFGCEGSYRISMDIHWGMWA